MLPLSHPSLATFEVRPNADGLRTRSVDLPCLEKMNRRLRISYARISFKTASLAAASSSMLRAATIRADAIDLDRFHVLGLRVNA